ncbi:MAG TPA: hypothetical protein VHQ46_02825 [Desulfobacteria bacterium]|nr:hypothetical protein [Desulfobacteria bacterium]
MNFNNWFKNFTGPDGKRMQVLVLVVVIAMVVVVLTGNLGTTPSTQATSQTPQKQAQPSDLEKNETALENKITATLEEIEGVGEVKVAVTLFAGPRSEYGTNQTHAKTVQEETPSDGGKRIQTQTNDNSQMVLAGSQGASESAPVRIVEYSPQISGVLVVAEGAKDPYIRERVKSSVQTLLGIGASKVRVEPLGKGLSQ